MTQPLKAEDSLETLTAVFNSEYGSQTFNFNLAAQSLAERYQCKTVADVAALPYAIIKEVPGVGPRACEYLCALFDNNGIPNRLTRSVESAAVKMRHSRRLALTQDMPITTAVNTIFKKVSPALRVRTDTPSLIKALKQRGVQTFGDFTRLSVAEMAAIPELNPDVEKQMYYAVRSLVVHHETER